MGRSAEIQDHIQTGWRFRDRPYTSTSSGRGEIQIIIIRRDQGRLLLRGLEVQRKHIPARDRDDHGHVGDGVHGSLVQQTRLRGRVQHRRRFRGSACNTTRQRRAHLHTSIIFRNEGELSVQGLDLRRRSVRTRSRIHDGYEGCRDTRQLDTVAFGHLRSERWYR